MTKGKYFITLQILDRLPIFPAEIMRMIRITRLGNASHSNSKEIEMRDKRIKLVYFTLGGSQAKQISLDWKRILLLGSTLVVGLCLVTALVLGGFTKALHSAKVSHYAKANVQLKHQLDAIDEKVQRLNEKMRWIEDNEKDLCVFVDMEPLAGDFRGVGTGGYARNRNRYETTSALDADVRQEALAIHDLLGELQRRMDLSMQTREAISEKYHKNMEGFKTFPSIWPLAGGRITDKFGPRIHPITGKPDDHPGIDISAPRGTDVWATADGVVVQTQNKYVPNRGYGRFIDIDHGNGYTTRYAHLKKIQVKVGQKVKRGQQVIGKVGDTGMATGPHLHYEVINHNNPKNPWEHMLD